MAKGAKTGGRKKGTPNRLTNETRVLLKNLVFEELDNLESQLSKLEPRERIGMIIKLLPFVLPKLETISCDDGEPLDFSFLG